MNIAFVIWMIGYPLASSLGKVLVAKRIKIEGKEPISDGVYALTCLVELVIWIYVGNLLFDAQPQPRAS